MEIPIFRRHPWPKQVELTEMKSMIFRHQTQIKERQNNSNNTKTKKTKWNIAQSMQFMNRLNMLSDSHLEILKIPFAKNPFSTPLSQLLSLSSCSSILLSRFFFLQRILPTATRFPLFHPAQAISLSSQLSLSFPFSF